MNLTFNTTFNIAGEEYFISHYLENFMNFYEFHEWFFYVKHQITIISDDNNIVNDFMFVVLFIILRFWDFEIFIVDKKNVFLTDMRVEAIFSGNYHQNYQTIQDEIHHRKFMIKVGFNLFSFEIKFFAFEMIQSDNFGAREFDFPPIIFLVGVF